jgi:hypothetical protein
MYDAYPITADIADALSGHIDERFVLDQFDYFLEYNADDGVSTDDE